MDKTDFHFTREKGKKDYIKGIRFEDCIYNSQNGLPRAIAWKIGWIEEKYWVTGLLTTAEANFLKVLGLLPEVYTSAS